jgi:hypothetical protein
MHPLARDGVTKKVTWSALRSADEVRNQPGNTPSKRSLATLRAQLCHGVLTGNEVPPDRGCEFESRALRLTLFDN